MAVVLRSSATGPAVQPGSSGIFTMPAPDTVAQGDLLLAIFYQSSNGEPLDVGGVNSTWQQKPTYDAAWLGNAIVLYRYVDTDDPSTYEFRTTAGSTVVGYLGAFGGDDPENDGGAAILATTGPISSTSASTSQPSPVGSTFVDEALRFAWWMSPTGGATHSYTMPSSWTGTSVQSTDKRLMLGVGGIGFDNPNGFDNWNFEDGTTAFVGINSSLTFADNDGVTEDNYVGFWDLLYLNATNRVRLKRQQYNVAPNPTFATDTSGWSLSTGPSATLSRITGLTIPGSSTTTAARITNGGASGDAFMWFDQQAKAPGPGPVKFQANVRRTGGTLVDVILDYYDLSGTWIGNSYVQRTVTVNTWSWVDVSATVPANTAYTRAIIGRLTAGAGVTIDVTDVNYYQPVSGSGAMWLRSAGHFTLPGVATGEQIVLDTLVRVPSGGLGGGSGWYAIIDQLDAAGNLVTNSPVVNVNVAADGEWAKFFIVSTRASGVTQFNFVIGSDNKPLNTELDIAYVRVHDHQPARSATSTLATGYISGNLTIGETAGPNMTASAEAELALDVSDDDATIYMEAPAAALLYLGTTTDGHLAYTGTGINQLVLDVEPEGYKSGEGADPAVLVLGQVNTGYNPAPSTSVVHVDEPPIPMPKNKRRYIAQNALTREFTSWEVPITDDQVTVALSGPAAIAGTIEPDIARELTLGSEKVLEPYRTILHCEEDGQFLGSCILLPGDMDLNTYDIKSEGFTGYPHGLPYMGEWSKTDVDPIDVMREVWRHIQSFPDSNLQLEINDKIHSTARVGIEREDTQNPESPMKPYVMNWWDTKDCGSVIDEMAKAAPFEYVEKSWWKNEDRSDIQLYLDLACPRAGTYRDNLRFVQGENIIEAVTVTEPEDWYANVILAIGPGEGRDKLMHTTGGTAGLGRLRRVHTYVNENITDAKQLKEIALNERARRLVTHEISSIIIDGTHPNALRGSFGVGDDILVQVEVPWVGELALKHRITEYTHDRKTDLMELKLKRSDSFRYGHEAPTSGDNATGGGL